LNQVEAMSALVTRTIVLESVHLCSKESDGIINQKISLDFIREMTARYKLKSGSRTNAMLLFDKVKRLVSGYSIAWLHGSGQHPSHIRSGSFGEDRLSPCVKSNTPGVGNGKLRGAF